MKIVTIFLIICIILFSFYSCSDPGLWGLIDLQDRMDAQDYSLLPSLIPLSEPTPYNEPTSIPSIEPTIEPPEPTPSPESPTANPTQFPETPMPSIGPIDQLVVYDDSLSGWNDASTGCTPDYNNELPVYEGTKSIEFEMIEENCTLSFVKETGTVDLNQFNAVSFHIHGGGSGYQSIAFYLGDQENTMIGGMVTLDGFIEGGFIQADSWKQVDLPLSALGVFSGFCGYMHFVNNTDGTQPVVYIDSIEFYDSTPFFPPSYPPQATMEPSLYPSTEPTFPPFPTDTAGPTDTAAPTALPTPTPGM